VQLWYPKADAARYETRLVDCAWQWSKDSGGFGFEDQKLSTDALQRYPRLREQTKV
jgi:hypothetical protein